MAWWRASARRRWFGLALVVVPSLVLLGLAVYQVVTIVPELRQSQDPVAHSIAVITTAQALERSVRDAERGQRGFLITGDAAYLEPYRTGIQAVPVLLSKRKQLTATTRISNSGGQTSKLRSISNWPS